MVEALQEPLPRTQIDQLGTADKPRVLVMGGGGIAPGVVTATLSIVRGLLERWMQPLGLVGSWEWVQNAWKKWGVIDFEKIAPESIDAIMHHWGTCLGPGRGMLKRDEFINMRRLQHEIGFIGTAVVGWDGTLSGSQALQYSLGEDMRPVADTVACIKTIDGDAEGSIAIGFETSAHAYAHAIKATIREVQWESGVGVIWVYGRDNGHLALHASTLAAQSEKICPVVTLVPEFSISREHFLDIVRQIKEKYGYVCIVASEGFAFEHEEQRIDTKKRDGAWNPKLLGCVEIIEEIIARDTVLQEQWKFSIRTLEPGIATRSCDPVESDIQLAKTVGEAVAKVIEQARGDMSSICRVHLEKDFVLLFDHSGKSTQEILLLKRNIIHIFCDRLVHTESMLLNKIQCFIHWPICHR